MNPWDERYAKPGYLYGTDANDFLRDATCRLPRGSKVLSLAEGEGRNAVFLAQQGHDVHAIDLSRVGLAKAEELARSRGVTITTEVADLAHVTLPTELYDTIIAIWCHTPSKVRARLHAEVVGALRPDGVFILESYTPRQLQFRTGGPPDADMLPTADELRAHFPGFRFEHLQELDREIHEGPLHDGMSAVVQCIARKP